MFSRNVTIGCQQNVLRICTLQSPETLNNTTAAHLTYVIKTKKYWLSLLWSLYVNPSTDSLWHDVIMVLLLSPGTVPVSVWGKQSSPKLLLLGWVKLLGPIWMFVETWIGKKGLWSKSFGPRSSGFGFGVLWIPELDTSHLWFWMVLQFLTQT